MSEGRRAADVVGEALGALEARSDLNAFTAVDAERSIAAATEVDDRVQAGRDPGPLAGVPVAVKDLVDHAGWTTTCGSSFYRHHAERTAPAVARLESAGAVVVGRTGLHEFAFGFSSENHWFGPVRNPWDPETSPGGSSGGSAAAVAAGICPVAVGTDTGGSVRVPAALCGVVGLKVTHGRIPLAGVFPLAASVDTVGPLGSDVHVVRMAYEAMAGYDPADPWSTPSPPTSPRVPRVPAALRVGVPQPWVEAGPVDASVRAAFQGTLGRLTGLGAEVIEVRHPILEPFGLLNDAAYGEVAEVHRRWWRDPDRRYGPDVGRRLDEAMEITLDRYVAALRWRAELRHVVTKLFEEVDVLITPTVGTMRKRIGVEDVDIDGTALSYRPVLSWFTALVNHMGVPALALPLAADGAPPPSIQLIAPWWAEDLLLDLGEALEQAGVVAVRPPPKKPANCLPNMT